MTAGWFRAYRINTYAAVLILTIFASGAALIIVHIGSTHYTSANFRMDETQYNVLRKQF